MEGMTVGFKHRTSWYEEDINNLLSKSRGDKRVCFNCIKEVSN